MQKKSFRFDKKVCVGKNMNLGICSKFGGGNFEGILGNPGEIPHIGWKTVGACCNSLLQPECKHGELLGAFVCHLVTSQHDVTNQIECEISTPVLRILSKIETDGFFCPKFKRVIFFYYPFLEICIN